MFQEQPNNPHDEAPECCEAAKGRGHGIHQSAGYFVKKWQYSGREIAIFGARNYNIRGTKLQYSGHEIIKLGARNSQIGVQSGNTNTKFCRSLVETYC